MKRGWIALILALLLMAALPASAEGRLPDCFQVDEIISLYNDQLVQAFMAVKPTETATKVNQYRTYGVKTEDNVFRFDNKDGKVSLFAVIPEGESELSGPLCALGVTIANGVNLMDAPVLKSAFVSMIAQADSGADLRTLQDWITGATKGGETLALDGYTLVHERSGDGNTFELVAEGAGGVDAKPASEPDLGPESGPDVIVEPVQEPDPTQATGTEALLSWKGFEVIPLRVERRHYSDGHPSLKLFLRVINKTGTMLTLRVEDMTIDGVPLPATNLFDIETGTDSGEDSDKRILIYPEGSFTDSVVQAVVYGKKMSVKLLLRDSKTFEDLYMEKVSLDLSTLPDDTKVYEQNPKPTPTPVATRRPEATRAPIRRTYLPLFEGDKGEDVRRMQLKLISLGYLNDTADGSFGPKTAAAVREFCETNGLGSYSYASSDMLERLYSGYATPYQEPWVPLVFQDGARGEWRNARNGQLSFRAKATNTSRTHTIRAFELYMYATDVWGDKIYGDSIYYGTSTRTLKPGQSAFSDYFLLPNRSQISMVYCGIKKVIFSDGTIRENDTVSYTHWTIK